MHILDFLRNFVKLSLFIGVKKKVSRNSNQLRLGFLQREMLIYLFIFFNLNQELLHNFLTKTYGNMALTIFWLKPTRLNPSYQFQISFRFGKCFSSTYQA